MKNKVGFIWQGVSSYYGVWHDGLREALKILEEEYEIEMLEPTDNLDGYDVLIYWEAPCTINGPDAHKYNRVRNHQTPKILLFAGGPVDVRWVDGFDAVCVESQINKEEFSHQGITTYTAFGINEKLFRPIKTKKKYKGVHHGTSASWKRQGIAAEAFGKDMLIVGRRQPSDNYQFALAEQHGSTVIEETHYEDLVKLINSADVLVQTSDYWGGGQRATLEAMACGLPVICMSDSPKNREYVEESGGGLVVDPDPIFIREAYENIMNDYKTFSDRAINYVGGKWTSVHYAYELKKAIESL